MAVYSQVLANWQDIALNSQTAIYQVPNKWRVSQHTPAKHGVSSKLLLAEAANTEQSSNVYS